MEPEDAPLAHGSSAPSGPNAPLNGTLEDYSPAGVLQMLSSQRETGAIRFSGEGGCTVYLHDGQLYFAETATTGEALAVALVRPGRLSPDEWDDATQAGYPTSEVGQELLNTGAIDRELLASVVLSVIYDPLIHLFRQGEGTFEFEPGTIHWMGPFRTFDVDAIVAEVRRRVREADEMAGTIPHLGVYVSSAPSLPADRGSVNLRRDDWEVAIAAAGGRRLDDLAVELGRGQWSTARLVYRLAAAGLLEVSEAPLEDDVAAAPLAAAPTVDHGVQHGLADAFAPADAPIDDQPATDWTTQADEGTGWADPADDVGSSTDTDWQSQPWAEPAADAGQAQAWDEVSATDAPWSDSPLTDGQPADAATDGWADAPMPADAVADGWADAPMPAGSGSGEEAATADSWSTAGDDWEPEGWSDEPGDPVQAGTDDHGISFDMPNLHPDIAKALAESTYADSATAINAMAARLGAAAEADDDEEWDEDPAGDAEFQQFWDGEGAAEDRNFAWNGAAEAPAPSTEESLAWQPSSWDTGVEAAPLPHRERSFAEEPGPVGPADPEWLENLYAEFMSTPEEPGTKRKAKDANPVEAAFAATPEATATKNKTLRRVISAIRRL